MTRGMDAVAMRPKTLDLDSRFVLRLYGWVAIVAGATITGAGIRGLPGVTQPHASLIYLTGMIGVAAGCAGLGLALNRSPAERRRALDIFATGHVLLGLFVWMQWGVYWGDQGLPLPLALLPLAAGLLLLASARVSSRPRDTEEADPGPAPRLRSSYDEHIRQIARREERARLARDLHDAVKQQLFIIQAAAATAQARFDADREGARAALGQIRAAAREATTEMEALLEELQAAPLENTGLVEALKKQCEALTFRTGARVVFEPGALPPAGSLPPGAHEAIYRVAQEALANVARHARASTVSVSLGTTGGALSLRVADNGAGFDASGPRRGMGTANMEARAAEIGGRVEIESRPSGTEVHLLVPLASPLMRAARQSAAQFGLMVLSAAVFYSLRGHTSTGEGLFVLIYLGVIGVLVIRVWVNARREQRRLESR